MINIRYLIIHLSVIVGLILMMLPLPEWAQIYRPHWVALMLIYWSMALPKRVGLWFAFFSGLVVDASQGTLLGQHAVGLIIITFINLNFYLRIRVLALIQQAMYVFVLLLINQLVITWTEGVMGNPVQISALFASPFIGMLIWPWVYVVLRDLRRKAMLS